MDCTSLLKGASFVFDTTIQTLLSGAVGYGFGGAVAAPPHNRELAAKVWGVAGMIIGLYNAINWQITGGREGNKKLFLTLDFIAVVLIEVAVLIGYKCDVVNGLAASAFGIGMGMKIIADLRFNQFWLM